MIGRKDVLFFAAFALYAWWMPRPASRWASAAAFVLGAAVTLAHEMFFFFTLYFFAMRLLEPGRSARLPDDPRSVRLQADLHRFTPELSLFGGALIALLLVDGRRRPSRRRAVRQPARPRLRQGPLHRHHAVSRHHDPGVAAGNR